VRPGAPITRDDLVRKLEGQKIQTRMLFAGNLVRQPAMTELAKQAAAAGRALPYRAIGSLARTDVVMNHSLWVGVYPGLTEAMRSHVVGTFRKACRAHDGRVPQQ
jgi:CDP-6-deoxy-D-xylo-4-hexulose-3-dehydrase